MAGRRVFQSLVRLGSPRSGRSHRALLSGIRSSPLVVGPSDQVSEFVVHYGRPVARFFHEKNVSFVMEQGTQSLAEACEEQGLDVEKCIEELQDIIQAHHPAKTPAWKTKKDTKKRLSELCSAIQKEFHATIVEGDAAKGRKDLKHVVELTRELSGDDEAKGEGNIAPIDGFPPGLATAVTSLAGEQSTLLEHLGKENIVVLPSIKRQAETVPFAISVMKEEHKKIAETLSAIRHLTHDFSGASEEVIDWKVLYEQLRELDFAVSMHILMDEAVLFREIDRVLDK